MTAITTATYWEIGRRIVEFEQGGRHRAGYGEQLLQKLSADLTARFGRGFGHAQVRLMRQFFVSYPQIRQSVIGELNPSPGIPRIGQSATGEFKQTGHLAEILQSPIEQPDPRGKTAEIPQSVIGKLLLARSATR